MAKLKEKVLVHRFLVTVVTDPRATDTASIELDLKAVDGVTGVEFKGNSLKAK